MDLSLLVRTLCRPDYFNCTKKFKFHKPSKNTVGTVLSSNLIQQLLLTLTSKLTLPAQLFIGFILIK